MNSLITDLRGTPLIELFKEYLKGNEERAKVIPLPFEMQLGYFLEFFELHNICIVVGHNAIFIYYTVKPDKVKAIYEHHVTSGYPYSIWEYINHESSILAKYKDAITYLFNNHNKLPY